ncbi:hypothetical protein K432DRAFT_411438 [Lepidopterella palustris CBS 459.81]|uniref:Uncharacterized protein n=1 Tax=Lepidopterella palustris CBS 459.81 TaxID=1314670 RepID=A0A8E2J7Y0_9PEZI|nr:hypothetical protein K432DRAFT_411438 [Lepidopterella palustris CBS 459.81]
MAETGHLLGLPASRAPGERTPRARSGVQGHKERLRAIPAIRFLSAPQGLVGAST